MQHTPNEERRVAVDFRADEFAEKYPITNLCNALRRDGVTVQGDTIDGLNALLTQPDLYNKVIGANKKKSPSASLRKLKRGCARKRNEQNLKKLNRALLEEFYQKETPKRQKKEDLSKFVDDKKRDAAILKSLSSGGVTYGEIMDSLRRIYKFTISYDALRGRLCKLRKMGFIKSRAYRTLDTHQPFALYALTELGALKLSRTDGYSINHIICSLPGQSFISHDFQVRHAVVAIKTEANSAGYEYSIYDEYKMRKLYIKKTYPDLFVRFVLDVGSRQFIRRYNIEIDNSTIPPDKVVEKVKKADESTIMLCPNSQRLEELRSCFFKEAVLEKEKMERKTIRGSGNTDQTQSALANKVVFAIGNDFARGGFLQTKFASISGQAVEIIPEDLQGKIVIRKNRPMP